jgi:hypothetical protein
MPKVKIHVPALQGRQDGPSSTRDCLHHKLGPRSKFFATAFATFRNHSRHNDLRTPCRPGFLAARHAVRTLRSGHKGVASTSTRSGLPPKVVPVRCRTAATASFQGMFESHASLPWRLSFLCYAIVQLLIVFQGIRFMGHHECTQSELRKFATDRNIIAACEKPSKSSLVHLLLDADKVRTFSKLFDIPPELRQSIYEYYVGDFGETYCPYLESLRMHALVDAPQPPLARVCRLLRHEVLPVFYSQCRFQVEFIRSRRPKDHHLHRLSQGFFDHFPMPQLSNLRKLDLKVSQVYGIIRIELDRHQMPLEFIPLRRDYPLLRAILKENLDRAVEIIQGREKVRFMPSDINNFKIVFDMSSKNEQIKLSDLT